MQNVSSRNLLQAIIVNVFTFFNCHLIRNVVFFRATPDPTVNMEALDIVDTVCSVTDTGFSLGSLFAKVISTRRKCSILFSNESSNYTLCNPW